MHRAIEIDPRLAPLYNNLAHFYCKMERDCTRALARLEARVRKCPDDPGLHDTLGLIKHESGDDEGALSAARKSLDLGYVMPASQYKNLGIAFANLEHWDDAREAFRKAILFDRANFGAWRNYVISCHKASRRPEALQAAQDLLRLDTKGKEGAWASAFLRDQ